MYIKEVQEITLSFPEDFIYVKNFENNPDWELISMGTTGVKYERVTKDRFISEKEIICHM